MELSKMPEIQKKVIAYVTPISSNPGLKFCFIFVFYLPMYCEVNICVIITVSRSKGSTLFCKVELPVLRQENLT